MSRVGRSAIDAQFRLMEAMDYLGGSLEASEAYYDGDFLSQCAELGITPPEPTWDTSGYFCAGEED